MVRLADEASSDLEEEGNSGRDNSQVQEETSSDSNLAPYMQARPSIPLISPKQIKASSSMIRQSTVNCQFC